MEGGNSNLLAVIEECVPDIHIGTVIIVPYAQGFKDPLKALLQVDEIGMPLRINEDFAIVSKFIYD